MRPDTVQKFRDIFGVKRMLYDLHAADPRRAGPQQIRKDDTDEEEGDRINRERDEMDAAEDERSNQIADELGPLDDDSPSGGTAHLSDLADLICEASPNIGRPDALRWLMHDRNGRSLLLRSMGKRLQKRNKNIVNFDRMSELREIVSKSSEGVLSIAKMVIDNPTYGKKLSEHEFTAQVTEQARKDYPKDRPETAFAKYFSDPINATIRQAHQMIAADPFSYQKTNTTKAYPETMPTAPTQVGGEGDVGEAAYRQLFAMAEKAHRTGAYKTVAQAFAAMMADGKNKELASASVLRTRARATSQYPGS
jgi:hypothetical protein